MLTRNQHFAMKAYGQINKLLGDNSEEQKKYCSMAFRLPILVRQAGLAQAFAFVDARDDAKQKELLDHLAEQFAEAGIVNRRSLLEAIQSADLQNYMLLTREVLAALEWYKRFAQSILNYKPGDEGDGGEEFEG